MKGATTPQTPIPTRKIHRVRPDPPISAVKSAKVHSVVKSLGKDFAAASEEEILPVVVPPEKQAVSSVIGDSDEVSEVISVPSDENHHNIPSPESASSVTKPDPTTPLVTNDNNDFQKPIGSVSEKQVVVDFLVKVREDVKRSKDVDVVSRAFVKDLLDVVVESLDGGGARAGCEHFVLCRKVEICFWCVVLLVALVFLFRVVLFGSENPPAFHPELTPT